MGKSKYVDTSAIVQVIGCIYKNCSLLEDKKYFFNEDDFPQDFHKILFGSIYNLYHLGAKAINVNTIEDYLTQRPQQYGIYQVNKGAEYLTDISEKCSLATFDYYYSRMKKMTLFRAYESIGFDLKWLYDADNIFDTKKKQRQEEWLDNTPIENIADLIDKKIFDIRLKAVENATSESTQAGEGALQLIEDLRKTPEVGYPLYGPMINGIVRGARLKKFYLRSASTGTGKAIPNNTLIPTPNGWKRVGDIKIGDKIFGQDGKETTVLQIHPQPQKKEIWKVTFADGRVAECCGEHLWEYRYHSHRGYNYRVEDIQTIYNRTLRLKNGLKNSDGKGYRFHIKLNEPIEYEEKQYFLPPYVMGALLGDGSFRYNITNKSLNFSSADDQIPNLIAITLGSKWQKGKTPTIYAKKSSDHNYTWTFRDKENPNHPFWVEEMLKDYPELWNVKSENKFIPKDYLQGSITQRQCLFQGLMDTDGSVDEKGRTSFTTVSPRLRDDFIELCRSLGFIATYSTDSRDKYTTGECYQIHIQAPKKMKQHFFRLQRKSNIVKNYLANNKREEYKDHIAIINIEKTPELSDMTCFTVDNKDHLFLMNDFIVTHNTRAMIADACNFACNEIYVNGKWQLNGTKEPTIYITTEQEISEIQTAMIAFLSEVEEDHILTGEYAAGEYERVVHAVQVLNESPLHISTLPDFSLQDIENTIKRGISDFDVKFVCFDYIHSSMKILTEVTSKAGVKGLREDNVLFMIGTRLKDLCNKYGIFIISSTQLNGKKK